MKRSLSPALVIVALVIHSGGQLVVTQVNATEETTTQRTHSLIQMKRNDVTIASGSASKMLSAHQLENRLRSKMSRICLIEKKLKRIFGKRISNYTSNLLRYYDLPLSPERLGPPPSPLQPQTYLAHRCSDQQRLLTWQNQLQPTQRDNIRSASSAGSNFVHEESDSSSGRGGAGGAGGVVVSEEEEDEEEGEEDEEDEAEKAGGSSAGSDRVGLGVRRRRRRGRRSCTGLSAYVSFSDLRWADWIVQPKGFVTMFCVGSCFDNDAPGNLRSKTKTVCCGPSHFKSLQVLQYDASGALNVTVLPNLIVVRCRCRRC